MDGHPPPAAAMRRSYRQHTLLESDLAGDWAAQFGAWFDEATDDPRLVEANAMQVATVDAAGRPEVRTVLLKAFDGRGIVFYTNYRSAKGAALAVNPVAAVVFSWLAQERQVRFTGGVEQVSRAETDEYFASRPRGSQLGAWASPQSRPVGSRAELDALLAEVQTRFAGGPVPAPEQWGGYRVRPDTVEFWQGRPDRMHDRLRYERGADGWTVRRLAP